MKKILIIFEDGSMVQTYDFPKNWEQNVRDGKITVLMFSADVGFEEMTMNNKLGWSWKMVKNG